MNPRASETAFHQAVKEFLVEARENLEEIERHLVELERDSSADARSSGAIGRMFRVLHSLKGSCGFLGYPKIEEIAHVGESLLGRVREGVLPISPTVITAMLSVTDAIREILGHVESENNEGDKDYSDLTQHVSQFSDSEDLSNPFASAPDASGPTGPSAPAPGPDRGPAVEAARDGPPPPVQAPVLETRLPGASAPALADAAAPGRSGSIAASLDLRRSGPSSPGSDHTPAPAPAPDRGRRPAPAKPPPRAPDRLADSTLRIDLKLLDKMIALAGELVHARNQILQGRPAQGDRPADGAFRRLNAITSELQGCIMQSRMQPIATVWGNLPRTVRDIALGEFKKVQLVMEGGETGLDKSIIEAIRDPLTHVLRNAVGHGIELPELRVALGKPAEGRVWLRAYHEGGQISIEVGDDGAGIDADTIRRKALERNLATPAQLARMGEEGLLQLIFLPSFSTAKAITRLSGRGVGLDVVKSNVNKLGGSIQIRSTPGQGTTVTLRIPLTLAIIQTILVEAAGERFALPQARIVELVRLQGEAARGATEDCHGMHNVRYRGRFLPVVRLGRLLGLGDSNPTGDVTVLVVLKAHNRHYGLVVDRVLDSQEVVVKPLWQPLRGITSYSGATLLADGTVVLILDSIGLAKRANLLPEQPDEGQASDERPAAEPPGFRPRVLLAVLPEGGRIALPADRLVRLENLPRSRIASVGNRLVMQYDGRIVRLIDVDSLLREGSSGAGSSGQQCAEAGDRVHVALFSREGRTVGFIVGTVLDIVEHAAEIRGVPTRPLVLCTTAIGGCIVELLNVEEILRVEDPGSTSFPEGVPHGHDTHANTEAALRVAT